MSLPTGTKWSDWQRGAGTTCSWTQPRRRRLLWILWTLNHFTSMGMGWRWCQTSASWEFTSRMTCSGVWTQWSWERCSGETLFPENPQGKQHPSKAAGVLLSLFNREHPMLLPLCVIVKMAQGITFCFLPPLDELHCSRCLRKAGNIIKDSPHPAHNLYKLLPSAIATLLKKTS